MRTSIYGEHKDNDLLFMYLVTLLEKVSMTFCIPTLIEQNSKEDRPFGTSHLQSVVYYCYRRITTEQPKYSDNS